MRSPQLSVPGQLHGHILASCADNFCRFLRRDYDEPVTEHKPVDTWLTDMDGVLVHEERAIPGAGDFIAALEASGKKFLVLTNNSIFTPRDLRARLLAAGIDIPEAAIWTSALATAQFLDDQRPGGTAYVIG